MITKFINFIKEDLDLTNFENSKNWALNHGPEDIDKNWKDPMTGKDLDEIIYMYINKYKSIIKETEIEVYRMIMLDDISLMNLKNVGVFWSFEKSGVGVYGGGKGSKVFVLTAEINTKDIDWIQGFYSFLSYGPSEFECYIKKGSNIVITHINDKKLKKELLGKA